MKQVRWFLSVVLFVVLCSCASGCFYQRLLTFKKQLQGFDKYFVLKETDETIAMIFKRPVMLARDTPRIIGGKPTTILGKGPNAIYEYRMIKQYAPNQREAGNFDFVYQAVMKDNKIERFVIDKRYFAVMPKPMFVMTCKMFGHAKLNLANRSLTMGKIDSEPYLRDSVFLNADEVRQLLGEPFEVAQNTYIYRYRLQQEGEEYSWPPYVATATFTGQGGFVRGESSVMGRIVVERPLKIPSYPVPANATAVNPQTLMRLCWKGGHTARSHRVYGGEDRDTLGLLGEVSDANEITLPAWDKTAPYYWRVDAVEQDGSLYTGEPWMFFPGTLVGRWTFDEEGGRVAHDMTGAGHDGTLQGDATFKPGGGILGGAVYLDGDGDAVDVNECSLNTHSITMTAWIKGHRKSDWAGLVHFKDALWGGGLYWCRKDHLHYAWNYDSPITWKFHGPPLPDGEWAFVAGVVDYDRATLYVCTRSGKLKASINKVGHQSQRVSKLRFGWDDSKDTRRFAGLMDDVHIYNYALTREQIEHIVNER